MSAVIKKTQVNGCEVSTIKTRFEFETLVFNPEGESIEESQVYSSTIEGALQDHKNMIVMAAEGYPDGTKEK